uniref:C-type lectin domain-containing protein n=1 Tax=Labrus bergylta TaxID=56723 RepID=A0A3Q3FDM8_9LABR
MSIFAAQSFAFIFLVGKEYYCPLGWSMYGEKCIMVINHEKTWAEAEVRSDEMFTANGGNLASVHSDLENHFIEALTKDKNYDFPETWLVHDLNVSVYFLITAGKKWHFGACNETLPFVCAKSNWKMDIF